MISPSSATYDKKGTARVKNSFARRKSLSSSSMKTRFAFFIVVFFCAQIKYSKNACFIFNMARGLALYQSLSLLKSYVPSIIHDARRAARNRVEGALLRTPVSTRFPILSSDQRKICNKNTKQRKKRVSIKK